MVFEYEETKIPLDMDEKNIDRTHIIALQEVDGLFRNVEISIIKPEQFIAEFSAMVDNPNRTVWDMQSLMIGRYPKTNGILDYIYPFSYTSYGSYNSLVELGTQYPQMEGYDELQQSWNTAANKARQSYMEQCRRNETEPNPSEALNKEEEARASLKRQQKQSFIQSALRWIDAESYQNTVSELQFKGSVKMFSKENIGWNTFRYDVSGDVSVELKTNFGYGNSAHFLLAVKYKGIAILPYSYIVKYYKANMADIVRCTRSYQPCRESWSASFDFLCDFINKSLADPASFVKKYIMNEVEEMMTGLEAIANNPRLYIDRIQNKRAEPCIINVCPMFSDEKNRLAIYPSEAIILFKVEKITGALDFLSSLSEIAHEVPEVHAYISKLLDINMSLVPEISEALTKISAKAKDLDNKKVVIEADIERLSGLLSPFEKEIEDMRKNMPQGKPFSSHDYELSNPQYVRLKKEKEEASSQLYKVKGTLNDLNNFKKILERSATKINELKVAA